MRGSEDPAAQALLGSRNLGLADGAWRQTSQRWLSCAAHGDQAASASPGTPAPPQSQRGTGTAVLPTLHCWAWRLPFANTRGLVGADSEAEAVVEASEASRSSSAAAQGDDANLLPERLTPRWMLAPSLCAVEGMPSFTAAVNRSESDH
eukprot:CAMPEP_0171103944 /NCGR_PEP_ID=MMETSP0766_2-20121228/59712_1 /TAXON_ID=439317 /ORGANISM="Gambierdiscus australes, Strain CAWD 149" /LENGTH=148 /DNA_ID=CAMNT_0011564467 /DNA_START=299 /DNA_END=746 /DNA_ORIENTATION=+